MLRILNYLTMEQKNAIFLFSFQIFQEAWFGGSGLPVYSNKYAFQHKLSQLQSMWTLFSFYSEMRSPVKFC